MRKTLALLALLVAAPASVALADDDCFALMADWQPRDALEQLARDNGWIMRRIKIDDGCYEIMGTDGAGREIEVKVHPATLAVLEIEYDDDDEEHDDHERPNDSERGDSERGDSGGDSERGDGGGDHG